MDMTMRLEPAARPQRWLGRDTADNTTAAPGSTHLPSALPTDFAWHAQKDVGRLRLFNVRRPTPAMRMGSEE